MIHIIRKTSQFVHSAVDGLCKTLPIGNVLNSIAHLVAARASNEFEGQKMTNATNYHVKTPSSLHRLAAAFIFTTGLFCLIAAAPEVQAAPSDINTSTHQGQTKLADGTLAGYTSGNITKYFEGDSINFRFNLSSTSTVAKSGKLEVRFSIENATCRFFDGSFVLGTHDGSANSIVGISGDPGLWTVTKGNAFQDLSKQEWVQVLDISKAAGGSGEIRFNYYLTIEDDIGTCSGSSQHSRLQAPSNANDVVSSGAQNVPVPGGQIVKFPDIIVTKRIDRDGDGSFESTAAPGEYTFTLDGVTTLPTDANGQVIFESVTPDGDHIVTESQVDFTQGTYVFDSGSGTNCIFNGATATANVAAGSTSTVKNAQCTFNNKLDFVPAPAIEITKTADGLVDDPEDPDDIVNYPGTPQAGDEIDYSFVVTNTGNVSLSSVDVRDALIDNQGNQLNDVLCPNDLLEPQASTTCTATYSIMQADINAGQVDNTAFADGDYDDVTYTDEDAEAVQLGQTPALSIDKSASPATYDAVNDLISYSYLVTNTGNVTISGPISVSDNNVDAAATCPAGDLAPLASLTCTASRTITQADLDAGSVVNVASASGTDPNGDPVTSPTDTETVTADQNPALSIDKSASPATYDTVGQVISYSYDVTNTGNVTISGPISVSDNNVDAAATCPAGDLAPLASLTCTASRTITQADLDAGSLTNIASASGTDPNGDPVTSPTDTETVTAIQNPALSIVKSFADDFVYAGGAGSSFTLFVTNDGNVTLTDALVEDLVDSWLTVTGVSGTSGSDQDGDENAQTINWSLGTLAPGDTATITVNFVVDSSVPEANGAGGVNDGPSVNNTGSVEADAPASYPGADPSAEDSDTINILTEIELAIEKWFEPDEIEIPLIPQGISQTFVIAVTNSGPSDALDVVVSDLVNNFLDVRSITVDGVIEWSTVSEDGACTVDKEPAYEPQLLTCVVDVPVGPVVEIVVTYLAAPFLGTVDDGGQVYADPPNDGTEFRFVFANDYILQGNALGPVYLTNPLGVTVELDLSGQPLSKNDFLFSDPYSGESFLLHLSCSDSYPNGFGEFGGPDEIDNSDWKIDYFSIARYKQGGQFFRNCGNVIEPFEIKNQASADGTDSNNPTLPTCADPQPGVACEELEFSNEVTVLIKQGIELDKFQNKAKHAAVHMTNFTGEDRTIAYIGVDWPAENGDLRQITIDGDVIWTGSFSGVPVVVDVVDGVEIIRNKARIFGNMGMYGDPEEFALCDTQGLCDTTAGWWDAVPIEWVLEADMSERIAFHFARKSSAFNYIIRLQFNEDGSFLSLVIPAEAL